MKFDSPWIIKLTHSNVVRRLARGGFWTAIGTVGMSVFGILTSIGIARILGKEDFGRYGLLATTVMTFSTLAGASMAVTSTKFLAQYRTSDPDRAGALTTLCWSVSAGTGGILALALLFFADPIGRGIGLEHSPNLLRVTAPAVLFAAIIGTQRGMFAAFEKFDTLAKLNITTTILNLCLILPLGYYFGVIGAIAGLSGSTVFNWLLNAFFLRRIMIANDLRVRFRAMKSEWRVLYRFSLPHVMGTILNSPVQWISMILITRQPGGIDQIALFSAAQRWRQVLLFLPGIIAQPSVPIIAERLHQKDYRTVAKLLLGTFGLLAFFCGTVGLALVFGAPLILQAYGSEFVQGGTPVLRILILAAFFQAILTPFSNLVTSAGHTWLAFVGMVLKSSMLIAVTYALVYYGAIGLTIAHAASAAVSLVFLGCVTVYIIRWKKAQ